MQNILNEVEKYSRNNIPSSWDKDIYLTHVEDVRKYALILAKEYGLDTEVVEIAALLHDTGYDFADENRGHAEISAEMAEKLLNDLEFDPEKVRLVFSAIKNHSMKETGGLNNISLTDQIIRDADGISFLKNNIGYYYEYDLKKLGKEAARESVLKKIDGMTNKIKTDLGIQLAQEFIIKAKELML